LQRRPYAQAFYAQTFPSPHGGELQPEKIPHWIPVSDFRPRTGVNCKGGSNAGQATNDISVELQLSATVQLSSYHFRPRTGVNCKAEVKNIDCMRSAERIGANLQKNNFLRTSKAVEN
jgi:hypothetical protein